MPDPDHAFESAREAAQVFEQNDQAPAQES